MEKKERGAAKGTEGRGLLSVSKAGGDTGMMASLMIGAWRGRTCGICGRVWISVVHFMQKDGLDSFLP